MSRKTTIPWLGARSEAIRREAWGTLAQNTLHEVVSFNPFQAGYVAKGTV